MSRVVDWATDAKDQPLNLGLNAWSDGHPWRDVESEVTGEDDAGCAEDFAGRLGSSWLAIEYPINDAEVARRWGLWR